MKKQLTCIICPRGCSLTVDTDVNPVSVSGHSCPRGEAYGIAECTNPVRTVTSVLRISNRKDEAVSVKTSVPVKKQDIFAVMEKIRSTQVVAPVHIGDVLIRDVCGADILATKNVD